MSYDQPPGYLTPAESNDEAQRKARKSATRSVLRRAQPREFVHRVKVPPFMDERQIRARMAEVGVSRRAAIDQLRQEWIDG